MTFVEEAVNPKLPLWETICLSYSSYFRYFGDILRASWLWVIITVPLAGLVNWLNLSRSAEVFAHLKLGTSADIPSRSFGMFLLIDAFIVVWIMAAISIAVAWHRSLLLSEHPAISGGNVLSKSFWSYIGIGILVAILVTLPFLLIGLPAVALVVHFSSGANRNPAAAAMGMICIVFLILVVLVMILRLYMLFPARAVGDRSLTFARTWRRTRGNTWRLFWGAVATTWPPVILGEVVTLFAIGLPQPVAFLDPNFIERTAILSAIVVAYYLLILPIHVGFLSFSYKYFFPFSPR